MREVVDQGDGVKLAVIGASGREMARPMPRGLWQAMVSDIRGRLRPGDVLVSSGSPWADHLAVHAFVQGWCAGLQLFLPAPLVEDETGRARFDGGPRTAGAAANHYHDQFRSQTGINGCEEIALALRQGALCEAAPVTPGYSAMVSRYAKIAAASSGIVAYTWGEAKHPAQGGVLDTWRQIPGRDKVHVSLAQLAVGLSRAQPQAA